MVEPLEKVFVSARELRSSILEILSCMYTALLLGVTIGESSSENQQHEECPYAPVSETCWECCPIGSVPNNDGEHSQVACITQDQFI